MSHLRRLLCLGSLAMITATGCTVPSQPGAPIPPRAEIVPADARAQAYGSTIEDLMRSPEIGNNIRSMFGPDWSGGLLAPSGASAYFARGAPPRTVRIERVNYVAFTGCEPGACEIRRVLILIREGGSEILARLDDGGFAHYYAYGNVSRGTAQLVADSALRALQQSGPTS